MKKFRRFDILSPWNKINNDLNLLASLLDAIIFRWTTKQADAAFLWLQGKNQESISKTLKISQPAVQQMLKTAGIYALEDAFEYFDSIIREYKFRTL